MTGTRKATAIYTRVGMHVRGATIRKIRSGVPPANAPSTTEKKFKITSAGGKMYRKGKRLRSSAYRRMSTRTLRDTGDMMRAVAYRVRGHGHHKRLAGT